MAVVYDFCEPKSIDYFTREQKGNLKLVLQFTLIQKCFSAWQVFQIDIRSKKPRELKD